MDGNIYYVPFIQPYRYQNYYYSNDPMYGYTSYPVQMNFGYWGPFQPWNRSENIVVKDYGPNPFVININEATKQNSTFRTALWTGSQFQITLMSLNPGEDIGIEMHPDVDQFLRLEQGYGIVQMGKSQDNLHFVREVADDTAIVIPAGTWHNVTNTGNLPLRLYSIYAPPNHPFGTVHETKQDAIEAEEHHSM